MSALGSGRPSQKPVGPAQCSKTHRCIQVSPMPDVSKGCNSKSRLVRCEAYRSFSDGCDPPRVLRGLIWVCQIVTEYRRVDSFVRLLQHFIHVLVKCILHEGDIGEQSLRQKKGSLLQEYLSFSSVYRGVRTSRASPTKRHLHPLYSANALLRMKRGQHLLFRKHSRDQEVHTENANGMRMVLKPSSLIRVATTFRSLTRAVSRSWPEPLLLFRPSKTPPESSHPNHDTPCITNCLPLSS